MINFRLPSKLTLELIEYKEMVVEIGIEVRAELGFEECDYRSIACVCLKEKVVMQKKGTSVLT